MKEFIMVLILLTFFLVPGVLIVNVWLPKILGVVL